MVHSVSPLRSLQSFLYFLPTNVHMHMKTHSFSCYGKFSNPAVLKKRRKKHKRLTHISTAAAVRFPLPDLFHHASTRRGLNAARPERCDALLLPPPALREVAELSGATRRLTVVWRNQRRTSQAGWDGAGAR